jgi:hypothetical protein
VVRFVHALTGPLLLAAALPVFGGQTVGRDTAGLEQCATHKVCFWSKPDFEGLPQFDDADPSADCATMDNVASVWFRDGAPTALLEMWRGPDCQGTPEATLLPGGKQDDFPVGAYKLEQM